MAVTVFEPGEILAGVIMPLITDIYEIAEGAGPLPKGAALGMIESSGKLVLVGSQDLSDPEATADGSEHLYGILAEDYAEGQNNSRALVYLTGEFDRDKLTFTEGKDWEDYVTEARKLCIFFRKVVK